MTGISEWERLDRYRYITDALARLADHRVSQETLAEIASRHVYTPVTVGWIQNHWPLITREVHLNRQDLWVFRPQWQWNWYVGATTHIDYPKVAARQRYREIASRAQHELDDGNLRALARVDAEMADLVTRYEALVNKSTEMEREFQLVLAGLVTLPVATEAMTRSL